MSGFFYALEIAHPFVGDINNERLIIFLHESLGSIQQWRMFSEKLCTLCACASFIYDRAGYGKSKGSLLNRQNDYLHLAADELAELITALIPENYREIYPYGHSGGGSIVLIYGVDYDKRIKGIITEAAHVFAEDETIAGVKSTISKQAP